MRPRWASNCATRCAPSERALRSPSRAGIAPPTRDSAIVDVLRARGLVGGISREQRGATRVVGAGRAACARAPARARLACGRCASRGRCRRWSEGPGAEPARPRACSALGSMARLQPVHLLGASIGAWRMACACRPDAAVGTARDGRGLHRRSATSTSRASAPSTDARERGVQRRVAAALRRSRGRGAVASATPPACVHQPRQRIAARQGRVRTPLGYCRRVRRQPAASPARWACCSIVWCSPTRATCCRSRCTSTRRIACR